jgi:ABC-type bacteriocin/lantibiotic exporter with double-glycine peptidase domain
MEQIKKLIKVFSWILKSSKQINLHILLITFLGTGATTLLVYMALISKDFVDSAVSGDIKRVKGAATLFILAIAIQMILKIAVSLLTVYTGEKYSINISTRLYKKLMEGDFKISSSFHSGDITTRFSNDIAQISAGLVATLPGIIAQFFQLLYAFILLYSFNNKLAFLALITTPILLLFVRLFTTKISILQTEILSTESKWRSYIGESFLNLQIIKIFLKGKTKEEISESFLYKRMNLSLKKTLLNQIVGTLIALSYWAGYFLAFYYGAKGLMDKSITFGTMAAFLQLVERIQSPILGITSSLPAIINIYSSGKRLIEIDQIPQENEEIISTKGFSSLVLENISFSYDNKPIIENLDLEIKKGRLIGIVGPSGKGKTTLLRIISSLLIHSNGNIKIKLEDGTLLDRKYLRNFVALVPQGNSLLSGTIKNNLIIDNKIDQKKVKRALEMSRSNIFIDELPLGIDTTLGEKGSGLSEGQAQRIAVGRALLKDSPILILDEATSGLDIENELKLIENLRRNCKEKAIIMVSHRESALMSCDEVYEIVEGGLKKKR